MAVIVKRETPQTVKDITFHMCNKESTFVFFKSMYMQSGCTISPTRRSEKAKLHNKIMDGERSEGVLNMAASTKELPIMDMSIKGALRTQFMMTIVAG